MCVCVCVWVSWCRNAYWFQLHCSRRQRFALTPWESVSHRISCVSDYKPCEWWTLTELTWWSCWWVFSPVTWFSSMREISAGVKCLRWLKTDPNCNDFNTRLLPRSHWSRTHRMSRCPASRPSGAAVTPLSGSAHVISKSATLRNLTPCDVGAAVITHFSHNHPV